jgi:hypothetical protein
MPSVRSYPECPNCLEPMDLILEFDIEGDLSHVDDKTRATVHRIFDQAEPYKTGVWHVYECGNAQCGCLCRQYKSTQMLTPDALHGSDFS